MLRRICRNPNGAISFFSYIKKVCVNGKGEVLHSIVC